MKNLFVGNMSFQTTESDLRTPFEPYREIIRIRIVQDRETGQPRGCAFVEIPDDAQAAKAISGLNGKEVAGRALKPNRMDALVWALTELFPEGIRLSVWENL